MLAVATPVISLAMLHFRPFHCWLNAKHPYHKRGVNIGDKS